MGAYNSSEENHQVLLVGFEKSGKSLFLKKLIDYRNTEEDTGTILNSTMAFDYVRVKLDNTIYDVWELGGSEISRIYWPTFYRSLKFGTIFYCINIFDKENHLETLKQLIILTNEEELKNSKFFIIFNCPVNNANIGNLQGLNYEEKMKYANEIRISLINILREYPIYDYELRIKEIMVDISLIKEKEVKTEELLKLIKHNNK